MIESLATAALVCSALYLVLLFEMTRRKSRLCKIWDKLDSPEGWMGWRYISGWAFFRWQSPASGSKIIAGGVEYCLYECLKGTSAGWQTRYAVVAGGNEENLFFLDWAEKDGPRKHGKRSEARLDRDDGRFRLRLKRLANDRG